MASVELTEQDLVYTSIALARDILRNEQAGDCFKPNVEKLTAVRNKIVHALKTEYPKDYDG